MTFQSLKERFGTTSRLCILTMHRRHKNQTKSLMPITDYYQNHNANIHRAVYALAEEATRAYEEARDKIADFIGVDDRQEIIFVRGTTEAINLVAYSWGRPHIQKDDIIVTTEYEHHSNIVPWQLLAQEKGAKLKYIGCR